jgi:hypothetical protein
LAYNSSSGQFILEEADMTNIDKQKTKKDLVIWFFATLIPLIIYVFFENVWNIQGRDESINFWLRFWLICLSAYGLAGLGCTIVFIYRKERFHDYGLIKNKTLLSIALSILVFIPHFLFMFFTGNVQGYFPMNGTVLTRSALNRPFPQNILCMGLIFLIWGFFEGMNYVFISKKINMLFPPKNKYRNVGAIFGGVACVVFHGMIGLGLLTLIEAITVFIFVYGILIIKDITGNAWGCVFSFLFLWNAF